MRAFEAICEGVARVVKKVRGFSSTFREDGLTNGLMHLIVPFPVKVLPIFQAMKWRVQEQTKVQGESHSCMCFASGVQEVW